MKGDWSLNQCVSVRKVNGFQCKAIAIKSSILDIAGISDPLLITIFGKVIFSLMQVTVVLFNLMAIYGSCDLYKQLSTVVITKL